MNARTRILHGRTVLTHCLLYTSPEAKLAIGPAIADGFYYDFDTEVPFTMEDLAKIEKEMQH